VAILRGTAVLFASELGRILADRVKNVRATEVMICDAESEESANILPSYFLFAPSRPGDINWGLGASFVHRDIHAGTGQVRLPGMALQQFSSD
jgi:hypothetical protein